MLIGLLKLAATLRSVWEIWKTFRESSQIFSEIMTFFKPILKHWRILSALVIGVAFGFLIAWTFKPDRVVYPDGQTFEDIPEQVRIIRQPTPVYIMPPQIAAGCRSEVLTTREDLVYNADLAIDWRYRGELLLRCWQATHDAQNWVDARND